MNYLSMTFLDDPSIAELLDDTGDVKFGRMRMQEWLEPLRVMLQTPPEADRSAELAQRARLDCLADPSESRNSNLPALEFVIHTRWAKNMPRGRRIRPSQKILERFLGLASATDQDLDRRRPCTRKKNGPRGPITLAMASTVIVRCGWD
jgi:hypothetical protein